MKQSPKIRNPGRPAWINCSVHHTWICGYLAFYKISRILKMFIFTHWNCGKWSQLKSDSQLRHWLQHWLRYCIDLNLLRSQEVDMNIIVRSTIRRFLFMDDIKVHAKNEWGIYSLIHIIYMNLKWRHWIIIRTGERASDWTVVKKGKLIMTDGVDLPAGYIIKSHLD